MAGGNRFATHGRTRKTRRRVLLADRAARWLISAGGIGTMVAVAGVCVFLVWVVVPLFRGAEVSEPRSLDSVTAVGKPLYVGVDEYGLLGWTLLSDGTARAFRLEDGKVRAETTVFPGGSVTAVAFTLGGEAGVAGFADGTLQLLRAGFRTTFVPPEEVPTDVRSALETDAARRVDFRQGVMEHTTLGQFRLQELTIEAGERIRVSEAPVSTVAFAERNDGPVVCAVTKIDGEDALLMVVGEKHEDFLTGRSTVAFSDPERIPLPGRPPSAGAPAFVAISGSGNNVYAAWKDGWLARIQAPPGGEAFVAEEGSLLESGVSLTAMEFELGQTTLVWGDSDGGVHGGFLVSAPLHEKGRGLHDARRDAGRTDHVFAVTKTMRKEGAAVTALAPSSRERLLACGFADGTFSLYNVTSETRLGGVRQPPGGEVTRLAVTPKEDGVLALTPGGAWYAAFDAHHPEADFASLFLPVWYEGYDAPQHTWQSSSGHTGFEPKLGLMPLIFGTVKATLYSMLFGAPLALLAAIYTSEFLHPRVKGVVKPTIELMASLPSVVLGFLAALVVAPFAEDIVTTILLLPFAVPAAVLACAYLWQALPSGWTVRLGGWRLAAMIVPLLAGLQLARAGGPYLERHFFGGDFRGWTSWVANGGDTAGGSAMASAVGGWLLLLLPLCALLVTLGVSRFLNPWLRLNAADWERRRVAGMEMLKFGVGVLATFLLAWVGSLLLDALGFDPRAPFMVWGMDLSPQGTFVQRNSLIVGFIMGFAIIPIIYTISEDALSAVPEHLRSASLGAGATRWQTAQRIVIPTAMSGLFSALMIGLGRAVGETMIVLMATGNTPIMEMNIFNGFRTLSANIATELPEAVKDSTHYRTLFLAALVLFVMTFLVNTVAEIVRLRFRRRAYQL